MNDTAVPHRGLAEWGGSAAFLTVAMFWAALWLAQPLATAKAGELIASVLWFPYVLGVPLVGFATLFSAAYRTRRLGKRSRCLLIQALLGFSSIVIWFWSLDTRLIELP
jgi:hypothetical protein